MSTSTVATRERLRRLADDFGYFAPSVARAIVAEQGKTWEAWVRSRPMAAGLCEAGPLLHWLGL